jgi:hypothetical protein
MATISRDSYTIGGIDLYWSTTVGDTTLDAGTTNGVGSSFRTSANNMGNIVMAEFAPDVSYLEHYITTSSGDKRRDHTIVTSKALNIPFTFDEMNQDNLEKYFMGQEVTDASCVDAASPLIKVFENVLDYGSAQLYFRTDIGQDMVYMIPKCTIRPDGNMAMNIEDWWTGPLMLEVFYYNWTVTTCASCTAYYGLLSISDIS